MKEPLGMQLVHVESYEYAVEGEERGSGIGWICTEVDGLVDARAHAERARQNRGNRKRSIKVVRRPIGRWEEVK